MSKYFFLSKSVVKSLFFKFVYTINDTIILVSDTRVMMGSLQDFLDGSLNDCGPFNDVIVTAAFDYKRKCLVVALNDSTIWLLSADSKSVVGKFDAPHLICIDHFSRAMIVASIDGVISWSNLNPHVTHVKCLYLIKTGSGFQRNGGFTQCDLCACRRV
jgi:hypothetical protein